MTKMTEGDLSNLPMAQLVAIHNLLADADKQATGKTFSQRSKAVKRIAKLAGDKQIDLGRIRLNAESIWAIEPAKPAASNVVPITRDQSLQAAIEAGQGGGEEPKPKAKARKKGEAKEPKGPSIRQVAEGLLLEVVGKDGDGRKLGHAYEVILGKIREQFPGAATSVACLRWYAVHMREKGTMPPHRPRAVPAKAQEQEQKAA